MGLIDIISGHVNEAINKNEDLSEKRLAICKECPLKKHQWVRYVILDYILMKIIKQTIQIDQKLDIEKDADVDYLQKQDLHMQDA